MRNKYSAVSDPQDFVSCPGDPIHVLYSPSVGSDGRIVLKATGKESIQDRIESMRSTTDMAYILRKLSFGDTSVLRSDTPMFGDFSSQPKTLVEAMQLQLDAEARFMQLPLDVRNAFDHDYRRWLVSAGSPDWLDKMRPVIPDEMRSINNNKKSEFVQSDESVPSASVVSES